jgi:predicted GH43/DUF377 family glycosyl hydrolase
MFSVTRNINNPIIQSSNDHPWRSLATFNCSPAEHDGQLHLLYRAMANKSLYNGHNLELSTIGRAISPKSDMSSMIERHQLIVPEEPWEEYGCEDPRVTKIDDTFYIFYTALSDYPYKAENIKVALAISKDLQTIDSKHLITPFNAKAMSLFPKKVNGKYTVLLTADTDKPPSKIAFASVDKIEQLWDEDFWNKWYLEVDKHSIDLRRAETDHCEVGAPPIWTERGWLLVYSHIQNYFDESKRVFGIEAVLLNKDNPQEIIGQTRYPFLVPEETYEKFGQLPDIVFPSGATLEDDKLTVFYGAADTVCASASLSLEALLAEMEHGRRGYAERHTNNPILESIKENEWESMYVLNPTAIDIDGTINIVYRAIDPYNTSTMGIAKTNDGFTIDSRESEPIYVPRTEFELKLNQPAGNSGCEDGRIMRIEDRLYVTYTGYNGQEMPAVAASSISVKDFKNSKWDKWTIPELISPRGIDDKDAAIFDRKIDDKYLVLHRIDHHVCADYIDNLDFSTQKLTRCIQMFGPRPGMWDSQKVGINGPPFLTDQGWVLFYHGISDTFAYCMGAVLLDKEDPTTVIGRTAAPIMEPVTDYELKGWIDNVVFSCGQVVRGDLIYIYYGGADTVVGVATLSLSELLNSLRPV